MKGQISTGSKKTLLLYFYEMHDDQCRVHVLVKKKKTPKMTFIIKQSIICGTE